MVTQAHAHHRHTPRKCHHRYGSGKRPMTPGMFRGSNTAEDHRQPVEKKVVASTGQSQGEK
jgi:hypothetical protein